MGCEDLIDGSCNLPLPVSFHSASSSCTLPLPVSFRSASVNDQGWSPPRAARPGFSQQGAVAVSHSDDSGLDLGNPFSPSVADPGAGVARGLDAPRCPWTHPRAPGADAQPMSTAEPSSQPHLQRGRAPSLPSDEVPDSSDNPFGASSSTNPFGGVGVSQPARGDSAKRRDAAAVAASAAGSAGVSVGAANPFASPPKCSARSSRGEPRGEGHSLPRGGRQCEADKPFSEATEPRPSSVAALKKKAHGAHGARPVPVQVSDNPFAL